MPDVLVEAGAQIPLPKGDLFLWRDNNSIGAGYLETSGAQIGMSQPERESRSEATAADLRLASAVRNKDRKATAEFVEAYADSLYAYIAHRLFPNMAHAEDLVQEAFLAALQSIAGYAGKSSLQSWLLGIARHKVDDHYRRILKDSRMDDVETLDVESCEHIEDAGFQDYERVKAVEILGRLREDYRLLLRWKYWDLKSASEMAAATGKTEKAIERALARARVQFRKLWENADG